MTTFAAALKFQMASRKYNQATLAAATGLSNSAISQLVNGVTSPSKAHPATASQRPELHRRAAYRG